MTGGENKDYATVAQVNAKYTKPEIGIPKSDLAVSVQTSLGKADTALQSAPVASVNGKTGAVTLGAGDVGALPSGTKFVSSVNGQSGAVTGLATTSEVNAKYTKPSDGIPKSDLAVSVQTSLGKADTALQNVPSYNDLPNIPVQNQDLAASGFTPVANTYYRHTGTGGGTPTPVNPYIVNQDASNQYINAAIDPMSNIRQFVFDGQIGHMLGYNEDGIISDAIKMVKIADGHYQLQYTVDGETYQTMWDNTLPDPWTGLKQIGTLERDKVYYWKSDMGNASMVENQNVWGAYISKDGQWTGGGSAYTTGVIYYYNGTGYAALDGSGSGGGKTYQLVKKTMRCTVTYDAPIDELQIGLPSAANRNILDVLKENNNCSLRVYLGLDTMTGFYVDLQSHQRDMDKDTNPSSRKYFYDLTGGFDAYVK